jgi:CheY-like chemotaxis protein
MFSKRALVVDDSKSARAFLARILERHEIAVDAADSAEAAIEYLTRNRPDVIFMDHLMPGMDGFQAVQSIKNNPRTSSIPILMYTSQEGDLYLGQARALGAEGVLPKQIKQADVTRMLFQLRLVSERRTRDQTTFTALANAPDLLPANESAIVVDLPVVQPPAAPPGDLKNDQQFSELLPRMTLEIRAAFDASLQKELAALRDYLGGRLDTQADRLQGDLATLLPGPRIPELSSAPLVPERRASTVVGWTLAVLAMAGAAALAWLWWNRGAEIAALKTDLAAAYVELETLRGRPVAAAVAGPAPEDPGAVLPAPDAVAAAGEVQLVPIGGLVTPPVTATAPLPEPAAPAATPAASVAVPATGTPAAPPPSHQAQ